jgi:ADP-ribose pyrophosphatase
MTIVGDHHLIEEKVRGEEVHRGQFLRVFRDTVKLLDGDSASREYVVHPGSVMVVPLMEDDAGELRVVLERQFRYPVGQVMIEFPAGKLDPGEDVLSCAQRELREETGYTAREWARAGMLHPVIAYSTEFIEIWFARGLSLGERKLDRGEFLDVLTATLPELLQWCRDGKITDAKTLVAALWLQNMGSGAWELKWQKSAPALNIFPSGE